MGYIYRITNMLNGKMYIGQTIMDLKQRWKLHKYNKSNCIYLKNAIQKYGNNNFKYELICICFDNDLNKFEKQYILKYNTLVPNGYNLREGGNSDKHHEETKKKISESVKKAYKEGRLVPPNTEGNLHTPEEKNKISDSMSKNYIVQYTKEGHFVKKFKNLKEAAFSMNCNPTSISQVCRNKPGCYTCKGYIWKYEKK